METGLASEGKEGLTEDKDLSLDKGACLETDGETSETARGEIVDVETEAEPGARAEWNLDGGQRVGRGRNLTRVPGDAPTSLVISASCTPEEEEEEVMEQEQTFVKEDEASMDTSEVDSLQSEQLPLRC